MKLLEAKRGLLVRAINTNMVQDIELYRFNFLYLLLSLIMFILCSLISFDKVTLYENMHRHHQKEKQYFVQFWYPLIDTTMI